MLMFEKIAQHTWCPFQGGGRAWEHVTGRAAFNREDIRVGVQSRSCIGSKCAAWRWKADPDSRTPVHFFLPTGERWSCEHCKGTGKVLSGHSEQGVEVQHEDVCPECEGEGAGTRKAPVGFCGLAGPVELVL